MSNKKRKNYQKAPNDDDQHAARSMLDRALNTFHSRSPAAEASSSSDHSDSSDSDFLSISSSLRARLDAQKAQKTAALVQQERAFAEKQQQRLEAEANRTQAKLASKSRKRPKRSPPSLLSSPPHARVSPPAALSVFMRDAMTLCKRCKTAGSVDGPSACADAAHLTASSPPPVSDEVPLLELLDRRVGAPPSSEAHPLATMSPAAVLTDVDVVPGYRDAAPAVLAVKLRQALEAARVPPGPAFHSPRYPPWRPSARVPPPSAVSGPSVLSACGPLLAVGYGPHVALLRAEQHAPPMLEAALARVPPVAPVACFLAGEARPWACWWGARLRREDHFLREQGLRGLRDPRARCDPYASDLPWHLLRPPVLGPACSLCRCTRAVRPCPPHLDPVTGACRCGDPCTAPAPAEAPATPPCPCFCHATPATGPLPPRALARRAALPAPTVAEAPPASLAPRTGYASDEPFEDSDDDDDEPRPEVVIPTTPLNAFAPPAAPALAAAPHMQQLLCLALPALPPTHRRGALQVWAYTRAGLTRAVDRLTENARRRLRGARPLPVVTPSLDLVAQHALPAPVAAAAAAPSHFPDDDGCAFVCADKSLWRVRLLSGTRTRLFQATSALTALAALPHAPVLLLGTRDGSVLRLDLARPNVVPTVAALAGPVDSIVVHPAAAPALALCVGWHGDVAVVPLHGARPKPALLRAPAAPVSACRGALIAATSTRVAALGGSWVDLWLPSGHLADQLLFVAADAAARIDPTPAPAVEVCLSRARGWSRLLVGGRAARLEGRLHDSHRAAAAADCPRVFDAVWDAPAQAYSQKATDPTWHRVQCSLNRENLLTGGTDGQCRCEEMGPAKALVCGWCSTERRALMDLQSKLCSSSLLHTISADVISKTLEQAGFVVVQPRGVVAMHDGFFIIRDRISATIGGCAFIRTE